MKISKQEAKELLKNLWLPVSSNRATILAADTKAARQVIIREPGHEDRPTAAAIEIQRIFRGYTLRCKLYGVLHGHISMETQGPHSSYKWSDLSVNSSQDSCQSSGIPAIIYRSPSTPEIPEQASRIAMSNSRVKLEEDYNKWVQGEHESTTFEDYCALVIQSWWHQVCKERRDIRVPSVRPPTMAESYSSFSHRTTSRLSARLTRQGATKIIQRAWRKHVDMQVYRYYRDLISFKFRGDPALLLRCINPKEWTKLSPGQTKKQCCGNICDSRCFLECFPVCPPIAETNFASREARTFPTKLRNI